LSQTQPPNQKLISVLSQQPKVDKAHIFGSRAKGNYNIGSDIDLALQGSDLDFNTIRQISNFLNEGNWLAWSRLRQKSGHFLPDNVPPKQLTLCNKK
jgi:hypothetical protein